MSLRKTIIVLILLALVGGYALYSSIGTRPPAIPKLLGVDAKDIAQIELRSPTGDVVVERGKDGLWKITKPAAFKADQNAVNTLAQGISDALLNSTVEEKPDNLAPFGLDPPRVVITVTLKDGRTMPSILVGSKTPVGYSDYVKLSDKPAVLLTDDSFSATVIKTDEDLRDHSLLAFPIDQVQRLTLAKSGAPTIVLDRNGDEWTITQPAHYKAEPIVVQAVLTTLAGLRSTDFVVDSTTTPAEYGLDQPSLVATVYIGKKGEQQSLIFGKNQLGRDGVYVQVAGQPSVETVMPGAVHGIDRTVNQLRDKTLLAFDPADVFRVDAHTPMEDYVLARVPKSGAWTIDFDNKTQSADAIKVEDFLDELRYLKGQAIIAEPMKDPASYNLARPPIDYKLYDSSGKMIGEVKLAEKAELAESSAPITPSAAESSSWLATSSAGTAVYAVDSYDYTQINRTAYDLGYGATPVATATPG